ncbi:MAG: hypothetical protein GY758_23795 [Fuerstiella sp.]|nr:hypothetical protein [Fuerstiella sp.]
MQILLQNLPIPAVELYRSPRFLIDAAIGLSLTIVGNVGLGQLKSRAVPRKTRCLARR